MVLCHSRYKKTPLIWTQQLNKTDGWKERATYFTVMSIIARNKRTWIVKEKSTIASDKWGMHSREFTALCFTVCQMCIIILFQRFCLNPLWLTVNVKVLVLKLSVYKIFLIWYVNWKNSWLLQLIKCRRGKEAFLEQTLDLMYFFLKQKLVIHVIINR